MTKYLATIFLALLASACAVARDTTLEFELPTENCDTTALEPAEILEAEIYISASPIPASDTACPTDPAQIDEPPTNFSTLLELTELTGTATVDLFPGPYFARMRVRSEGGWSQFSNEVELDVPGPSRPPILLRWALGT